MLSAEVRPYAAEGGLSDVLAALPQALAAKGAEVKVFSPLHGSTLQRIGIAKLGDLPAVTMGRREYSGELYVDDLSRPVQHCFIGQPDFFGRDGIYLDPATGEIYPDDFERFNFFMLAALEALRELDWRPHVIHCHDSRTALIPAYLKLLKMGDPFYRDISSVLTVHNLAYQGLFSGEKFGLTGLPSELFYPLGPFEYYGKLNLLKAGVCYADLITTVSRQYAREIQTVDFGCGLHEVLQRRRQHLSGILNGIDTRLWDPATDPVLTANYSWEDPSGKSANKRKLQELCGFPLVEAPLIGFITRLPEQDGMELLLRAAKDLESLDCQWVVLATGLRQYSDRMEGLARQAPSRFALRLDYSDELVRQIHAGCDMLALPSRYEPCGLNQMYGMRYGTIPIVRHCGGLADTVQQFNRESKEGQGFKFYAFEPYDLVKAVREATTLWREDRCAWQALMANAMRQDFSWERSAESYLEAYRQAMEHR